MLDTRVGYTGGQSPSPTYESVRSGDGHTEALRIHYDPDQVSYTELLDHFFKKHRPQPTAKTQYKSAIWCHDSHQLHAAETSLRERAVPEKSVSIAPAMIWHDAEEYHQKYVKKFLAKTGGE